MPGPDLLVAAKAHQQQISPLELHTLHGHPLSRPLRDQGLSVRPRSALQLLQGRTGQQDRLEAEQLPRQLPTRRH